MKFTKTIEVKNIFNKISYKYDFLNNLLSFGLHRLWKRKLVNLLEPSSGEDWADLCCGTGDLAFLISERVSPGGSITGIDSAGIDVLSWAKKVEELGAGEILLTSMDGDGTQNGYDLNLTESVANIVDIPVIASGGAGCLEDIYDVFNEGRASAALLASLLLSLIHI